MTETTNIFVALDRSGSMNGERWTGAITSLNEYVQELKKNNVVGKITIIAFDKDGLAYKYSTMFSIPVKGERGKIELVDLVKDLDISDFEDIDHKVISPRGMTPLFDAAGHVLSLLEKSDAKRNIAVIITDGEENCSVEYTQSSIKSKVDSVTAAGNEVIFLGANFDVSGYSGGVGLAATKSRNVDLTDVVDRMVFTSDLSASTVAYATRGVAMNVSRQEDNKV